MAQQVYQGFYDDLEAGNVTDSADARAMLAMSNTTIDTEEDVQTLSGFTTIDEGAGAGYAELVLANLSVGYDTTNDRLVIDAGNGDFDRGGDTVAASTRNITRICVYRYVDGTDANDVPWFSIDVGPYAPVGGAIDVTWNSTGIAYIGQP